MENQQWINKAEWEIVPYEKNANSVYTDERAHPRKPINASPILFFS